MDKYTLGWSSEVEFSGQLLSDSLAIRELTKVLSPLQGPGMAGTSALHPGESQAVKNIRYVKGKVIALYHHSPRDPNVSSVI